MAGKHVMTVIFSLVCCVAMAQDPRDPDSLYIGNIDGSPVVAGLNEDINIPVWVKTDDTVAFMHIPLASNDSIIVERSGAEYIYEYCVPYPDRYGTLIPNLMPSGFTNQSFLAWWDWGSRAFTGYEWCHILDFFMKTTASQSYIGDTVFCFREGSHPINGGLLFGLQDGVTEVYPATVYGSIYFAETGIEGKDFTPAGFHLFEAYPNPFNASVTIKYSLPELSDVNLVIYDIRGRAVRTIYKEGVPAGVNSIVWNGTCDSGGKISSGVYLYRISAGEYEATSRMTLLK
ncbi:MAG: T9SS type A sorting domain-containing protein [Candidatus Zixiibacteriota bacterium]|nr:MAG: T9SS type A sorting domain-containing protein [candidate division Zixibacteria bacterium]